jgi:hypothetical protein
MTTKSLLRLCTGFVGATGIGLIIHPGFVILLSGGGLSGDRPIAGGVGLVLLLLSLTCWPNGDDIDGRAIWGPSCIQSHHRSLSRISQICSWVCQCPALADLRFTRCDCVAAGRPGV